MKKDILFCVILCILSSSSLLCFLSFGTICTFVQPQVNFYYIRRERRFYFLAHIRVKRGGGGGAQTFWTRIYNSVLQEYTCSTVRSIYLSGRKRQRFKLTERSKYRIRTPIQFRFH